MSEAATTPVAVFGDPQGGRWGVLIGGQQPRLALSAVSSGSSEPEWADVELDRGDAQVWTVAANGTELKLELAGATSYTYEDGSALSPFRLSGTATIADKPTELDFAGALLAELPDGKLDSLRVVGSWFADGHELALVSVRPKGGKGHDGDHLDVVARGEDNATVFDPRLSTTYGPDGKPRKAGIEVWLGDDEDGEQHPRRVTGVASGPQITGAAANMSLSAYALDCVSRGDTGVGVYLLISPTA